MEHRGESPRTSVEVITGSYTGPEGTRAWRLAVPAGGGNNRPVIVMLHGCLQDAADLARGSQFDAAAERFGALVLYPEQPISANPRKCWNWFDEAHQQRGRGEPALLAALVNEVVAKHQGDPSRVHLVGISAGAAMATLLTVAYPEQFASLTSIAGIGWRAAPNVGRALAVMQQGAGDMLPGGAALIAAMGERARAVPVLVVHGVADNVVSVRNARETVQQFVQLHDQLAAAHGGTALRDIVLAEATEHGYRVQETQWRDATGAAQVTLLTVEQLGHAFPFGASAGTFTDANGPDLLARVGARLARRP